MNNKFKKAMAYIVMLSFPSISFAGGITVSAPVQQGAGPLPAGNVGGTGTVSVGGKVNITAQRADVTVGGVPSTVDMKSVLTNLVVNITDNNVNPDVQGAAAAQGAQTGGALISAVGFPLLGHDAGLRRGFAKQIEAQVSPGSGIENGLMAKTPTYTNVAYAPGGDPAMRAYQNPAKGNMLDFNVEVDKLNSLGVLNVGQTLPNSTNGYMYQSKLVPLIAQLAYHVKKEVPAAEQAWRNAVSANAGAFSQGLADLNTAVSGTATDVYSAALAVSAANGTALPAVADAYAQAVATASGATTAAGQVAPAPNTSSSAISSLKQQLVTFQATPDYALLTTQQQTDLYSAVTLFTGSLAQWDIYNTQLNIYNTEQAKVAGSLKSITKTGKISASKSGIDQYFMPCVTTATYKATVTYSLTSSSNVKVATTVGKLISSNKGTSFSGCSGSPTKPVNTSVNQTITSSCSGGVCSYTLGKNSPYIKDTYVVRDVTRGGKTQKYIDYYTALYSLPVPFSAPPQATPDLTQADLGPHGSYLAKGATVTYSQGPNQSVLTAANKAMKKASTAADSKAASANVLLSSLSSALTALANAQTSQAGTLLGQAQQISGGVVAASPILALLNSLQAVSDGLASISNQAANMAIFTTQIVLDDIRNASDTLLAARKTIAAGNLADSLSAPLATETTSSAIAIGGKQGSPYMLALDTLNAVQTLRSAAMYVYEATRGLNLDKDSTDPTKVGAYVDNLNSSEFVSTKELGLQANTQIDAVSNYSSIYSTY